MSKKRDGTKRATQKINPKTSRALLEGMQLQNITARFAPGGKRRRPAPAGSEARLIAAATALRAAIRR